MRLVRRSAELPISGGKLIEILGGDGAGATAWMLPKSAKR